MRDNRVSNAIPACFATVARVPAAKGTGSVRPGAQWARRVLRSRAEEPTDATQGHLGWNMMDQ